jgi:hypothetical protein
MVHFFFLDLEKIKERSNVFGSVHMKNVTLISEKKYNEAILHTYSRIVSPITYIYFNFLLLLDLSPIYVI